MADKLIFPIGFDLESGLKAAQDKFRSVAGQIENAIKRNPVKVPIGFDEATAKRLREEAKDIERALANIKNQYGSGQLKGLSIGFVNTQKEIEGIRRLEAQLQTLQQQRTALVNAGATVEELKKIDAAIRGTEFNLKGLTRAFNKDMSSNVAITQQITKLKQLSEELAGIDRMYARLQATASAANRPVNSFEANEMLVRRREIMEEITRVTRTATEAQRELFNIKGVGVGASQGVFGIGGEQGLSAITEQISRYETLKKQLQEVEGQYERLKAMQAQGMGDQSEKINQTLQRRIAIQKELGEITQTATQAQKELEKKAQATAAAFQRGRTAIDNFNRVMKLPENRIMNIQQKINLLNQALKRVGIYSAEYGKITMELARLGRKLDEAKAKQEALTGAQKKSGSEGSRAFRTQGSYLNVLIKRLAVYASFGAFKDFLTKVREVTAQFELQRISLGAIINDQAKANSIFSEIKNFALKSPVKILDLTKQAKQLAAFRFEADTLFETTKRMADISVGLGVPADRLILALGHVKAQAHLTGITLRQFAMAGIPMLELLAERYSELEGHAVSVADVQKRVHDKMVSFEDVNQIFTDLTSKGGMFYNMQEKQGNTLYGMWAKLGDAASVMYDQIGNTEAVGKGMRTAIQALTDLMRNWQMVPRMLATVGLATLVYITRQKILKLETAKVTAVQNTYNARMMRTHILLSSSSSLTRAHGFALGVQARMFKMASMAANAFGTSLRAIGAAIASTGWGVLVLALGYIVEKLFFAKTNAEKAAEAINKITEETAIETEKSVRNFEYLANKAVSAPKGSVEQKDALEELNRTYNKIFPQELLELEYLEKLNGKYGSLTNTIREYIAEQQRRKALDEITNVYGAEKQKYERKLTNYFRGQGWTEAEIARFWEKFYDVAKDKSKGLQQVVAESVKFAGREGFEDVFKLLQNQDSPIKELDKKSYKKFGLTVAGAVDYIDLLRDEVLEENKDLEQAEERLKANTDATNAFAEAQKKAAEELKKVILKLSNGKAVDRDSYLGSQMLANFEIKGITNILKEGFTQAGLVWDAEYGNFIEHINTKTPELISSLNFDAIIDALIKALDNDKLTEEQRKFLENLLSLAQTSKKRYEEIVPADPIVRVAQTRFKQIAQSAGGFREQYNQYLMKAEEDMATYNKRLKDSLEDLKNRVKALLHTQEVIAKAGIFAKMLYGVSAEVLQKDIDETNKTISIIEKILSEQPDYSKSNKKGSKGSKSDTRLQSLQEMWKTLKQINEQYDDLTKKEGAIKAAEDMDKRWSGTLATLNKLAARFGMKFNMPLSHEDLNKYGEQIIAKIKAQKGLKDQDKAVNEATRELAELNSKWLEKEIEKKLKDLADRISRTKTAKEFYEKILGMTGDYSLASKVADSIFGQNGSALQKALADQVRGMTNGIALPDDIISADNIIDYKALRQFAEANKDELGKMYDELIKIADNGEKELTKNFEGYLKDLDVAKTYADKRVELARTTAAKIREIEQQREIAKKNGKDTKVYDDLIRRYQEREDREAAKLEYDAFKDTPLYVQMFEDLEHASTSTLEMMKQRLEGLSRVWGTALDPTQLKEIQSRMNEIDGQLKERNPFKTLKESYQQYRDAVKSVTIHGAAENAGAAAARYYDATESYGADSAQARAAEKELKVREQIVEIARKITAENKKGAKALDEAAQIANDNLQLKRGELEIAAAEEIALRNKSAYKDPNQDPAVIAAHEKVEAAKEEVNLAERVAEITTNNAKTAKTLKESFVSAANQVVKYMGMAGDLAHAVADTMEALGGDEEDVQFWNDIGEAIGDLTAGFQGLIESVTSANVAGVISNAIGIIPNMVKGFVGLFTAGKVRKANKEIKRQQELLEQLEYTYGRLEKAADKVFGRDYVNNYNQQLKNLQAQQQAYLKQAEAERSKGKKKDKEKIKEYEKQARETADKIKELQDDLVAHFTGSTKTDVARQMAKSWVDARASMSDTFAAIKGNYQDLIKNMIVEGAAARVIENALTPVWDSMQKMLDKNDVQGAIDSLVNGMDSALNAANNGMEVLWKALEARGYDMKKMLGDTDSEHTGIAKSVAGATSEEINNVAAIGNTLMYYVSPIPRIDENLARVVAIMEGRGASAIPQTTSAGWTDWQQQAMDNYQAIARNTAETVVRCERAAIACEKMARVIKTKGATSGFNVFLNS